MFTVLEAPALNPLPRKPFILATWSTAKVGPDIHARVGKTLYSIPWRFIGQQIDARSTVTVVQFFHQGQLIATHGRKPQGKQTDFGHYPPEKIAFTMRTPTWCRTRAAEIGPACTQVIGSMLEVGVLFRLRAAQGVLGLADKYSAARVDAAYAKAIAVGDPSYRTIKGILAAGTDTQPGPEHTRTGDGGAPAFLHGPAQLFANVIPMPGLTTSTGMDQSTTDEDRDGHGDNERVAQPKPLRAERRHPVAVVDTGLKAGLRTLKLSGMLDTLDARLAQARNGELGHLDFLQVLCHDEITRRETQAMSRRIRRAHFEQLSTLEEFDFGASSLSGIGKPRSVGAAQSTI